MKLNLDGKSLKVVEIKLEECLRLKRKLIAAHERSFSKEPAAYRQFEAALMDLICYVTEDGIDGIEKV